MLCIERGMLTKRGKDILARHKIVFYVTWGSPGNHMMLSLADVRDWAKEGVPFKRFIRTGGKIVRCK
jgi:hypothetical protein